MRVTVSTCSALLLLLSVILCGCGGKKNVRLFGAASTANALEEIRERFERASGVKVDTSYAASSVLAQQIVSGAAADVFVSANVDWAAYVDQRGMVQQRRDLLQNRLVIVVPEDSQLEIRSPQDLLGAEIKHLALGETGSVPAGIYAKEALAKLGLWERLEKKVVPGSDVRQTLTYVETGAAEAGIVYSTDAKVTDAVKIVAEIPADLTGPIRYPVVLLKHASGSEAAESFYQYLLSEEAAGVFAKHGFIVRSSPAAGRSEEKHADREPPSADGSSFVLLSEQERAALWLSFQVAICAAVAGLPFGVAIGYLLARVDFRGKWLVETVVHLPLVLPPVVTGYLMLVCFAPRGPIGSILTGWFGVEIVFTWLGAVLASTVVSFPLMVRAIRLAFQGVDPRLEMAARSLGASRMAAFLTVSLPLARRGLIAGWLLAFARSLGEFGATIMIAGNIAGKTQTIPLAIFSQANTPPGGLAQCWRLVVLSVLLACGALAVSELLERRQSRYESA